MDFLVRLGLAAIGLSVGLSLLIIGLFISLYIIFVIFPGIYHLFILLLSPFVKISVDVSSNLNKSFFGPIYNWYRSLPLKIKKTIIIIFGAIVFSASVLIIAASEAGWSWDLFYAFSAMGGALIAAIVLGITVVMVPISVFRFFQRKFKKD